MWNTNLPTAWLWVDKDKQGLGASHWGNLKKTMQIWKWKNNQNQYFQILTWKDPGPISGGSTRSLAFSRQTERCLRWKRKKGLGSWKFHGLLKKLPVQHCWADCCWRQNMELEIWHWFDKYHWISPKSAPSLVFLGFQNQKPNESIFTICCLFFQLLKSAFYIPLFLGDSFFLF